jgi:hypothetical protein
LTIVSPPFPIDTSYASRAIDISASTRMTPSSAPGNQRVSPAGAAQTMMLPAVRTCSISRLRSIRNRYSLSRD